VPDPYEGLPLTSDEKKKLEEQLAAEEGPFVDEPPLAPLPFTSPEERVPPLTGEPSNRVGSMFGLGTEYGVDIPREDIEKGLRPSRQERIRNLETNDDPGEADMSRFLTKDKAWLGNPQGRDGIEVGPKNLTSHHEGSTDVGIDMNDVESVIKAGARRAMRIEAEINDVLFKDKTVNPKAKFVGTSVVNHYPIMLRRPPSVTRGIIRSVVIHMVAAIKHLEEAREESSRRVHPRKYVLQDQGE
jgi:hypothetical protein